MAALLLARRSTPAQPSQAHAPKPALFDCGDFGEQAGPGRLHGRRPLAAEEVAEGVADRPEHQFEIRLADAVAAMAEPGRGNDHALGGTAFDDAEDGIETGFH